MSQTADQLAIAESYLDEMLQADSTADYALFTQRFEKKHLLDFPEEKFLEDIMEMRDELGTYKSRVYFGCLNGKVEDGNTKSLRFVWRAFYEKNEALIVVGIHQIAGVWHVHECMSH